MTGRAEFFVIPPSYLYAKAETRAEFAERSVAKLEKTIDDLEETLASAKEENVEIHQTLDETLLELNNL